MGGGDEPPLGPNGGLPASSESLELAVELGVGEDRLDRALAFSVERDADLGREDPAHERVIAATPAGPLPVSFA
jgi:hypothetical protein